MRGSCEKALSVKGPSTGTMPDHAQQREGEITCQLTRPPQGSTFAASKGAA